MSVIHSYPYNQVSINSLSNPKFLIDWPTVYFLENGSEAYIGETTGTQRRFKEHYKRAERQKLTRAHVIIDDDFNKSATLDIESWLIQYTVADGKFTLQNGNRGIADHSYFDREKYRAKFEILWSELQKIGLANQDLIQLRNSDIFKYSPYKALTNEQMSIVRSIEKNIYNGEHKTYVINGDPGTGKSVLATFLIKYLVESEGLTDLKIALVVPMTSLRKTLQRVFKKVKGLSPSMVLAPNQVMGNEYDILVVDEAHRLRQRKNLTAYQQYDAANKFYGLDNSGTQLDWILRASKSQVLLFDEKQTVMPGDIDPNAIKNLHVENFYLTSQLRVKGGDDYISFIDNLLNLRQSSYQRPFVEYDLQCFNSAKELIDKIKERDSVSGLSRVVAGYAWDWKTKKGTQNYDIEIDNLKLVWNSTNIDWVNSPNAVNEIGCIHTVQGYDLNYVGVIIGPEISYDPDTRKLIIDRDKYRDINGKRGTRSADELNRYIINIYKTLLTRGIYGTYIYAVDRNLNNYIQLSIKSLFTPI